MWSYSIGIGMGVIEIVSTVVSTLGVVFHVLENLM